MGERYYLRVLNICVLVGMSCTVLRTYMMTALFICMLGFAEEMA